MRKWLLSILSISAVLAVMGSACSVPVPKDDPFAAPAVTETWVPPSPGGPCDAKQLPPDAPNLDHKRYVTVYGCVEDGFQPVELITSVRDVTTGELGTHTEPSANTWVRYLVGYDTGHDVRFQLEFKPSRPGSVYGFLYVSDGKDNRKIVRVNGGWRAQVDLQSKR